MKYNKILLLKKYKIYKSRAAVNKICYTKIKQNDQYLYKIAHNYTRRAL